MIALLTAVVRVPGRILEPTYADLFDTDLDALADVLGEARPAALETPITTVENRFSYQVLKYRLRTKQLSGILDWALRIWEWTNWQLC